MKRLIVLGALTLVSVRAAWAQDTLVVRADNRPLWGDEPRLVEELRIGGLNDPIASFGLVAGVAVDGRGVMWVADAQAAEVRRFGPDGRLLGVVGRKGEGPGEFGGISGIKRMPDGRFVVWDAHLGRFDFFSEDGAFLASSARKVGVLGGPGEVFQVDTAGYLYHLWMWPSARPGPARALWYKLAEDGTLLDSVAVPPSERQVAGGRTYPFGAMGPFSPMTMSVLSPHGYLVVGRNTHYAVSRPLPNGRTLRIERGWRPVRVQRGERAQYRKHSAHVAQLWEGYGFSSEVPTQKPPYWAIRVDEDARLWIARHSEGVFIEETGSERQRRRELARYRGSEPPPLEWWEPLVVDVIEATGRFLGTIRFPSNCFSLVAARGRQVWAIESGANDEQYVVRFRIEGT